MTARAARPTAEAKSEAWRRTVEQDELPNESLTAVVQGFNRATDPALIAPYEDRYFAMLTKVWEGRSNEIANRLVQGYFPASFGGRSVLDAADCWLADHEEAAFGLRRVVVEGRDTVARAQRVREADKG